MGLARRLYRGETAFPLIQRRKRFYIVSLVLVVIALASMLFRGFNLGVEFKGGEVFTFPAPGVSTAQARSFFASQNLRDTIVQTTRDTKGKTSLRVETGPLTDTERQGALLAIEKQYNVSDKDVNSDNVGASWGKRVTNKALQGLFAFLIAVIIYISIRFEPKMAAAAIIALIHDLILAAGIYSILGFVVTPSTVIALLTVLGYSLYDTIVVFDKVEENTRGLAGGSTSTYSEAAELAVNQTFMRSINTSLIALLPVSGLLFVGALLLGAGTLKDLALALFVGLASGAYSSLFLATPLLADLKEREPQFKALSARVIARRTGNRPGRAATSRTVATAPVGAMQAAAPGDTGLDAAPGGSVRRPTGPTPRKKGTRPSRPAGKRKR